MPLKDLMCWKCRKVEEVLVKMDSEPKDCEMCGTPRKFLPSAPAKTSMKWGDNGMGASSNINGIYDRGLGATYYNSMERDALCKAKGLVPLSEVGGDSFVEKRLSTEIEVKAQQDKVMQTYLDKKAEYGGSKAGAARAVLETFPANDCLGNEGNVGTLNKNVNTGIIEESI